MASSSVPRWAYDVFLSFRGEDNFVDHLYKALHQSGLLVFKDDKMLQVGTEISPKPMKAIEESTCAVVVFSKNYANSTWCLAKVMECCNQNGRLVIPVFYHVGQKRDFETAFQQHEEKFREVLKSAADLVGYHITKDTAEASVITKIVEQIHGKIQRRGMEKNEIGIKSHINKLKSLLDLEATEKVCMIGIWGMGGLGKTTIARALFREIRYKFGCSCFVHDVRENFSDKEKVCILQKEIVKQIAHYQPEIRHEVIGSEMIRKIFCEKKILLVLDDVDDARQLEVLGARLDWFGKGSRIVVTTRDHEFLTSANDIYSPDFLPKEHALELFSWHAFERHSPLEGYKELSNRAIGYTYGLPLALKVLGCFFRGKRDEHEWESHLNRLAKAKNSGSLERAFTHKQNGIMQTLKISLDGLDENEREIFFDIACFFKGRDQEYVIEILDCSDLEPRIGISALIRKALITVSRGCIHMHDVLQEMGLEIVRKSYPNTRLCRTEEIRCLEKNNNLETVTGIMQSHDFFADEDTLTLTVGENVRFSGDVFEKMNNIRLLETWGYFTSCVPTTFPDKLGWLRWTQYPFSSLPVANMHKVVRLNMHDGVINHLWRGCEHMPNLKSIYLSCMDNMKRLPDVSGAVNLKDLTVTTCVNLRKIHKSLGTLKELAYLDLRCCENLRYLPSMEEMPKLEIIDLTGCRGLKRFPEVSSSLVTLSNIHLNGCSNLKNLPNSICDLTSLKILHLQDCGKLQDLPEELGSKENLEEVLLGFEDDDAAWSIDLPYSINMHALTKLCCLRKLDLSWRQMEEQDFPKNFHEFSSLEELHLSGNSKLVRLPASICCLSSLKHLELNKCHRLQNIQGLPSGIQVLKACDCISLEEIEDLTEKYASLHTIFLGGCKRLLKNDENKAYLDKMLHQSFVKKCIAVERKLSIWIPGSMIPSWSGEKHHDPAQESGSKIPSWLQREPIYDSYDGIEVKLPPQRHTSIIGFVVCVIIQGKYLINFPDEEDEEVSMVYIPESVFWEQMNDDFGKGDWSLLVESHRSVGIIVRSSSVNIVKRCGAYIVYKKDRESIQQIENGISESDHGNSEFSRSAKSHLYYTFRIC